MPWYRIQGKRLQLKDLLELLLRLSANSTQGWESGTELTTTNCPSTSFRVIMVFLPSHSCSWINDPSSFKLISVWNKEPKIQYLTHGIWWRLMFSNTLIQRKKSHPSSPNFVIVMYKAGILSYIFIDPLLTLAHCSFTTLTHSCMQQTFDSMPDFN